MKKLFKKFKLWIQKKIYVPGYCKLCGSCGEEGCCSAISCMHKCMVEKNPFRCQYGHMYAKDMLFAYRMYEIYSENIELFRNNKMTEQQFLDSCEFDWNDQWDKTYIY